MGEVPGPYERVEAGEGPDVYGELVPYVSQCHERKYFVFKWYLHPLIRPREALTGYLHRF